MIRARNRTAFKTRQPKKRRIGQVTDEACGLTCPGAGRSASTGIPQEGSVAVLCGRASQAPRLTALVPSRKANGDPQDLSSDAEFTSLLDLALGRTRQDVMGFALA